MAPAKPARGTLHDFVNRNKRKLGSRDEWDHEPTDVKVGVLASLHPGFDLNTLREILLAHDGYVSETLAILKSSQAIKKPSPSGSAGFQQSLRSFAINPEHFSGSVYGKSAKRPRILSKKGVTLHLFDPLDIEKHTPCSVLQNFLSPEFANDLLREMLEEAKTFEKITFKLFDNVVASPHTSAFFVDNLEEVNRQKREYIYNGSSLTVGF